jgi:hypothetical protein
VGLNYSANPLFLIPGECDVYIFPDDEVKARVSDDVPRQLIVWHLLARFYGRRIACTGFCKNPEAASIAFAPARSRRKIVFFAPEFRQKFPGTITFFETLIEKSDGAWKISESAPMVQSLGSITISSLKDSRAEANTSSFVSFINACSIVDVKRSHDGIKRRGLVAKA